jgi:hypothetical protein
MAGSTLNSYFDYAGAANAPMPSNPYDYEPSPNIFDTDKWAPEKNPFADEPEAGETKGKSFLDKFTNALYEGADNASKFKQQQQEKEKERALATPSSMGGGNVQQLTDNFTALYPQTFSPFTVAGVQGEPGFGGKLLSAAAPLLGMIPGAGPFLAAGAKMGSAFLG